MSNGAVYYMPFLGFIVFLFFIVIIITTSSIFYFVSITELFLSQPTSFTFFPIVFPAGVGRGQCMALSRWLGLNHDMVKDGDKTSIKAGAKLEKSRQRQA